LGQQHRWWEMRLPVYLHQIESIFTMFNLFAITKGPLKRRLFYPLLSLLVALGLCLGSTQSAPAFSWFDLLRPAIQAIQLSNMSDKQEVALGEQINQQLVKEEVKLYRDRRVNAYVNQIGQQLARESSRPPTKEYKCTFQVVDDDNINAFATMGGFVYVHTGLLKAADNEAQLASVLAHEIGHITERHAIKQMRQMAIALGVASAAGLDNNTAVQIGVDLALHRPKSRQAEYEADRVGLQMLGSAGYAQSAMIDFMKKLLNGPSVPTVLSTHPGTPDRIQALSDNLNPAFADRGDGLNEADYKANIKPVLR